MAEKLTLHEDRFFDSDPAVRKIARELYAGVRSLPIVSPHGHVDPALFSKNEPFPDPAELLLIPDHYIFRMLYSRGISLESLGIPAADGTVRETDRRKIWRIFGEYYYLFAGTPTGAWLAHVFAGIFGIDVKLDAATAMEVYDRIGAKLAEPEYLPRALFDRFDIEVLTTTDGAADTLEHHRSIRGSGWKGRIIPCFRPDAVTDISKPDWKEKVEELSRASGVHIGSFRDFVRALEERRAFFRSMGAVSTDHAVVEPRTCELSPSETEAIFKRALKGKATAADAADFTAHMLMEMARMSVEDGLVMQIHAGSFRNHNRFVFGKFGPDKGCDIPVRTEFTRNLRALLNRYGNDRRLGLIVFTLDESTYSRELAPLAGHYPALRIGPPWWFHDSIEGMTRYRQRITETAGIYNTAGFNDDTRAFPSIPARHDLSRRVDCNFLARLAARHVIDIADAERMSRALAYDLAKESYRL
jgi:glucuronate isomerase